MSEGSFFIKTNNGGCFKLKQRIHTCLFEAFKSLFNTNRKIEVEKGLYNQIGVSSNKNVQKIIDFFSFSGLHPLVGRRLIEYLNWLDAIKGHHYQINSKKILHSSFLFSSLILLCILYVVYICCINPEGGTILNNSYLNIIAVFCLGILYVVYLCCIKPEKGPI